MNKFNLNSKKLEVILRKSFPSSKIEKIEKFSTGLVNPTYKVKTTEPKDSFVVKISELKNAKTTQKNNKILRFLKENNILVPEVLYEGKFLEKFITVMGLCSGEVASSIYKKSNQKIRKIILASAGNQLNKIHSLEIKSFWRHQKHEVKNKKEWRNWTNTRINKYLKFFHNHKIEDYDYLKSELNTFWKILESENIEFVPLHWDYHLDNLNVDKKGKITGVFDFDGAMKGHNLADIGIFAYFLRFSIKDYKNFPYFLKGYKKIFTKNELRLIRGYFLLQLLAVSRSIWFKKHLRWIIKEHQIILKEFKVDVI